MGFYIGITRLSYNTSLQPESIEVLYRCHPQPLPSGSSTQKIMQFPSSRRHQASKIPKEEEEKKKTKLGPLEHNMVSKVVIY